MNTEYIPKIFDRLRSEGCIGESNILKTQDGFWLAYKSLADILAHKEIFDVPGSDGERLLCSRFFDDWFLYAVPGGADHTYGLLKLREQEYDAQEGIPADGDTPGVTISFVSFACDILMECLADPADANRLRLNREINRVVVHRGQPHHEALKGYFIDPGAQGPYFVAALYVKHIAAFAQEGYLAVPEQYKKMVQQSVLHGGSKKTTRVPSFIDSLNQKAGTVICDHDKIYVKNRDEPTVYESAAILATHTGNTSLYSFAAEVEYHARFLTPMAKMKIPGIGRSVYDSAIRADMTIGDTEFQGPAPFYRSDSRIVKRQYALHRDKEGEMV